MKPNRNSIGNLIDVQLILFGSILHNHRELIDLGNNRPLKEKPIGIEYD